MADKKISALPAVVTPVGTDEFPVNQGGTTKKMTRAQVHALEFGEHLILSQVNEPATPTLAFGDGDSGFHEPIDDNLKVSLVGIDRFFWELDAYNAVAGTGPAMKNVAAGAAVAGLVPRRSDGDTGIGSAGGDILSFVAGGIQIAQVKEVVGANQFILTPGLVDNNPALPTLAFGDGDSGWYENADDTISLSIAGVRRFAFGATVIQGVGVARAGALRNETASATNPTLNPDGADSSTGIGSAATASLSLIATGIEGLRLTHFNSAILQAPSADVAITAFATGGQASATTLKQSYNIISVCATTGDSVKLPSVFAINTIVYIKNDGANTCDVFPFSGDDLGQGLNTAEALAAGVSAAYIATVANTTWTPLLAAVAADPSLLGDGTALLPAYSFTSDPDTGIYLAAVNELGFSTGGVLKATLTAAGRLGIGTPTPAAPLEVVGDQPGVVGGFQAGAFQVRGDGTAQFSNAVITGHSSFNGNTQLWYIGSASSSNDDILILNRQNGSISFSTNNIARFVIQADGTIKIVNKIENAVGTAALPSYSFTGDPDLGIFRVSADRIGISSNGALRWDVSANFITTTLNTRGPDSTALLPTYSFASDPDTGVFNVSADILGLAAGGLEGMRITEAGSVITATLAGDLTVTGDIKANTAGGPALLNEETSLTNPTVIPSKQASTSGLGGPVGQPTLIANSLNCISVTESLGARQIGFYVTAPVSLQTGVAVTAAGVHAALVNLGLITA